MCRLLRLGLGLAFLAMAAGIVLGTALWGPAEGRIATAFWWG